MGRRVTPLLAALLVAATFTLVHASALEPIEADLETGLAEVHVDTSDPIADTSVDVAPPTATEANDSVQTEASSHEGHVELQAEATGGEAEVALSTTEMTVHVGEGQLVTLTYTPPRLAEIVDEAPTETQVEDPKEPEETKKAETASQQTASPAAGEDEDDGEAELAWTIAPVAGVAAAAAASQAFPVGRWLRRVLGAAPLAPLYSRIPRDEVLDHESRAAIYELLEEQAGLSLETICRELDLARSTARHHVRKLEEADMVEHTKLGRARVHHLVGERRRALRHHLLANETRQAVYDAVREEARTITEIARSIDANPGSVHFHLGKLVDARLVEPVGENAKRYRGVELEAEPPIFERVSG